MTAARPGGSRADALPPDGGAEPAPPVALYVHVPFCVSHCPYCDFVVYAGAEARGPRARIGRFLDAVMVELELRADYLDARFGHERPPLQSVYLGGGTPSLVPPEDVARLLGRIRARFGLAPRAEVTIESNPSPDERGDLAALADAGVDRLSIGAQSMQAAELRRLGRRHTAEDVAETVSAARAARIRSINLDLLYDVPGQSPDCWNASLDAALTLAPDHLSLYALTLDDPDADESTGELGDHLPAPAGARRWRERASAEQDDDRAADEYRHASAVLAKAGWRGYELSNWARSGHECRHNLAYWLREPYEAIGPGAHAFDGRVRRWNAARLDAYLSALVPPPEAGVRPALPPGASEVVTAEIAAAERVILGLRLDRGVPAELGEREPLRRARRWAEESGLLEAGDDAGEPRLRLTTRGRLLSNELFARLV